MPSAAAISLVVAVLAAVMASTTSAQPLRAPAASPAPATQPAQPTPPAIQPPHGRPFIPVQGDWEGTANGFAASFNLVLDAVKQQRAGVPQYGIQDLVMLRPFACPPEPSHYGESIVGGLLPSVLGDHGSLGLSRFGLEGAFTGKRSAMLQGHYSLPSCHGMLSWHMHPAVRRTVANGTWALRYSSGGHSTFRVQAGGRLATGIRLPDSIAACNGLQGTLDVFIGDHGQNGDHAVGRDAEAALLQRGREGHAVGRRLQGRPAAGDGPPQRRLSRGGAGQTVRVRRSGSAARAQAGSARAVPGRPDPRRGGAPAPAPSPP